MLLEKAEEVKRNFLSDIDSVSDIDSIENIRIKYLGRNGIVSELFDQLKEIPKEEKPETGKNLNLLRNEITSKIEDLKSSLDSGKKEMGSEIDLSLPGRKYKIGSKHILTQTLDEMKSIFKGMGFSVYTGPELESDYYNFEALNFPHDHPARDMQDTFFVSDDFLLRTHTSPVQIRTMEKMKPPVRTIMPGRVYRNEAVSARSYCMFHQVEGLYLDEDVTFAELKGTLVSFAATTRISKPGAPLFTNYFLRMIKRRYFAVFSALFEIALSLLQYLSRKIIVMGSSLSSIP